MIGQVHFERDGDIAVVVIDNPPVNAGSHDIREGLMAAIAQVQADDTLTGAVLIGAGGSFIAGSDLREFDLPLGPPQMPQVIAAIEQASKPFVAALHGAALGGGYELALGCDARIAAPGTLVGLPETALGIIPGAGGTQKLPRLVGKAKAVALIASAARVSAQDALSLGMVDGIEAGDLRGAAIATARSMAGRKRRVIDLPLPESGGDLAAACRKAAMRARPHVLAAIDHVCQAGDVPVAQALAQERATFEHLRVAPEAKALRHIFFAEREAARGMAGRTAKPAIVKVFGVIGSGTMGAGIATAILQAGKPVILVDTDKAALQHGILRIEDALNSAVKRGRMGAAAAQAARAQLQPASHLDALAPCDLVIEAVFEDQQVKDGLFQRLDSVLHPGAILATNTSYLDIDRMAAQTARADHVIGLHFFSPAHIMKLLEIVRGTHSSDQAMATGFSVARMLGKQPVEARNAFGFIGNRVYAAYRMACEFMLEDGAFVHEVDTALEAFGFAMGPFAVADLSGLDIAWRMRQHQAARRNPADRYVHIPDRLCEAGRFGRKTRAGYYRYDDAGQKARDPEVEALITAASAQKGIARKALSAAEIQLRALAAIVNEAALLVGEGVALRANDVDVALVNGYGFPLWVGGPVHWARQQDADELQAACREFAKTAGPGRRMGDLRLLGVETGGKE
ncbi:3-hydroxyacyl-CoA dehydrogenase NAD-binding domain-containing protein [Roseinatronobacter sp. NSM]|uniref:3-hydroxyacyl-CoA dehydrogenase NAD-binding domain-containing protein n=1 Tax=Roseinatronobacter sp. NSM TaxID=3457785 RepID=UPI0040351A81